MCAGNVIGVVLCVMGGVMCDGCDGGWENDGVCGMM